jgi:hypothetical protein
MAFDAGAVTASLTVDTSAFDRDLDAAKAKADEFAGKDYKVRIAAEFDTSSLGRARQMFAQLDDAISRDAMTRLRSSPQGSVLGSLNALFSPHPVTGAPSPQQAASQGLLGKIVGGQSGGTGSPLVSNGTSSAGGNNTSGGALGSVLGQAPNASTTDDIRQVLQGAAPGNLATTDAIQQVLEGSTPGNLATTDDIKQVLEGAAPGNLSTTDDIKQVLQGAGAKDTATTDTIDQKLTGDTPKDTTTTNTVREKLDPASAAKVQSDSKNSGQQSGSSWGSSFTSAAGSALSSLFGGGGGAGGGGGGGGEESFLDKGLIGGLGPGILGISTLKASITGLVGAAVAALPALGGVAAGLTAVAGGAALLFTGNSKLKAQATALLTSLKSEFTSAAQPMVKPLEDALTSLGATFKSVGPEARQIFSAAAPLIAPLTAGLEGLVTGLLPGLLTILKAVAPAMDVFDQFIADVGKDLGTMFADFAPAIGDSSVLLKALLGVVTGLFPVLGQMGSVLAGVLGPAFTAFAGAIQALEPFLSGVAKIIGQFAGAVLSDLGGGLQLVATILKTVSPAFNTLATAVGQVFSTLESKGGFAQLGDVLESLAAPLGNLVTSLVDGLAPAIPPIITLFSDFVNAASNIAVSVLTSLLPPLTKLAATALSALVQILPVVVPLVTSLLTSFTSDASSAIVTIGTAVLSLAQVALTSLLKAAQPLIPVVVSLLEAFTPLLNVLTAATASAIAAVAGALAAVISAIPPGELTAIAVGATAVAAGIALWNAAMAASAGTGFIAFIASFVETAAEAGVAEASMAAGMVAMQAVGLGTFFAAASDSIAAFAAAAEGASIAEGAMVAGSLLLEAVTPFGWAIAATVAIGAVVAAVVDLSRGSQGLEQQLAAQDNATGYNIAGYQKLASQLTSVAGGYAKVAAAGGAAQNVRGAGAAALALAQQYAAQGQQFSQTAQNMQTRLTALSGTFGVSQTTIEEWAAAAGINAKKFAGSGESVDSLTTAIVNNINKNAQAVTSTASLSENMAIFGDDVFSATTQLDAFNGIWNTLVGNLLTKQSAVTQSATQFQGLQQTIAQSGKTSLSTSQAFESYIGQIGASVTALLKVNTPISQVNSYLQTQINNLKSLGPLNKSEQGDLNGLIAVQTALANTTKGLSGAQTTFIGQVESHILPDLTKLHANTPLVNTDVKNLADSIAQTGTNSASTAADRTQLIKDLEAAGVSAKAATGLVNGLSTSLKNIPKSVTSTVQITEAITNASLTTTKTPATAGLGVLLKAAGGYVSGPGGPADDSVPAWLSNGEYVISASAVSKYGTAMLGAINAQEFAGGGAVMAGSGAYPGRGYALGGAVAARSAAASEYARAQGAQSAMTGSLSRIEAKFDRLIEVSRQIPAGVGQHVGGALGGAAHDASFRARYPRGLRQPYSW